jgi:hypothetical protein
MLGKGVRYRYKREPVMHHGKLMRERLAFRGNKVIKIKLFPVRRGKK